VLTEPSTIEHITRITDQTGRESINSWAFQQTASFKAAVNNTRFVSCRREIEKRAPPRRQLTAQPTSPYALRLEKPTSSTRATRWSR